MSITKHLFFPFVAAAFLASCSIVRPRASSDESFAEKEVIYHVFQRSFYDSNGDLSGDLNGLREKLGYLQKLGITSIQLLPLYQSPFYHNYFTDNFYRIDSSLGTMKEYLALVREVHRRGMKIYMDMETQYVTEDHPWYRSAYHNLRSPYSNYLVWADAKHTKTQSIVMGITSLTGYNGVVKKLIMVNLKNPAVLDYNIRLFSYWLDPNHDGRFDDGVDGFRFDHMMDDLDNVPRMDDLFNTFWKPLIDTLKKINPAIVNVAEQADWNSWAVNYITKAGVDRVYSFKLMGGIRSFNKSYLTKMADSAFSIFPGGHHEVIFISNHDMPRFANQVNQRLPKMKIGAALNLLFGETPSIYYGQEIGMNGKSEWQKWGMTDANEIPDREAFEWYKSDTGRGMAIWYRNSGPWWIHRYAKPDDGISLEEEQSDSLSIYNFYKKMIRIKQNNPVIFSGQYQTLTNSNDSVFSFERFDARNAIVVLINFSGAYQSATIRPPAFLSEATTVLQGVPLNGQQHDISLILPAYGVEVIHLKLKHR